MDGIGEALYESLRGLCRGPRGQDGTSGVFQQVARYGDDFLCRLAGRVDRFGKPLAQLTMGV